MKILMPVMNQRLQISLVTLVWLFGYLFRLKNECSDSILRSGLEIGY